MAAPPPDAAAWTDAACREWLWRLRFSPDGRHAECPSCGRRRRFHRLAGRPVYSCDACGRQLSPTAGTLFHGASTSLVQWFRAVILISGAVERDETVPIRPLAAELGVSYATARRMRQRILAAPAVGERENGGSCADTGGCGTPGSDLTSARIARRIVEEAAAGSPAWAVDVSGLSPGSSSAAGEGRRSARRPGSRATRERILGATCGVIVDQGLAAVRVSDIARVAGLSPAIIHYYFATKDEVLLEAVVWQNARETARRAQIVAGSAPALEKLERFLEASMPPHGFAREEALIRYDLWGRAMREAAYREALHPLRTEWRRQVRVLVEEGAKGGAFRLADPLDQIVEELTALLDSYSLQYLLEYEWMTAGRLWELLAQFLEGRLGVPAAALDGIGCGER